MGLFSSREDTLKKLDEQLANIDDDITYKKALLRLTNMANENQNTEAMSVVVLHHDLQEIKKAIEEK